MPDIADSIDITTDLNGQSPDAVPYHGGDVPINQQPVKRGEVPAEGADKPEPSLRDMLSDAFKGQEPPKTDKPAEAAPDTAKEAVEAPAGDLVKVGERWHRKDGSFASKEEIAAHEAGQAPQGEPAPLPPWANQFTALEREQFAKLPAETRSFIERTMEGVNQQRAQYEEYGLLEQIIGPRRDAWAQQGMNPLAAVNNLFALSDFAGKNPGEFVMWFADQHRLDLDALLDARDAANAGGGDPALAGLQQEIAQLRNTINGFNSQSQAQVQARSFQVVQDFANEKGADGQPLYPYFNELSDAISTHVAAIRQQQPLMAERDVLKAAYDFAAYNNTAIREKMQQAQVTAQQQAAAAEAARARQAGVQINGGPAGDTSQIPNNANRTLKDELRHAWQQQLAGA